MMIMASSLEPMSATMSVDRVQFETLLSDISAQLIASTSSRIGETIESALESIRHFFRVDRCSILAVNDAKDSWYLTYASYAEGVPHVSGEINLALLYPWITRRVLLDEEPVIVSSLDEIPPEAATDRASCEEMGIVSFLNIPIKVGPKRLHLFVLNALREPREWPQEYVPRLRLLGQMIVNSLERSRVSEDVQRLREELKHENAYLRQEAKRRLGPGGIVGRGTAIRRALLSAEQVAATDSTVLLLGETGSGKERFASYIHECSRRRDRLMVRVNCSAIPTTLMESELFGREKGAYTGALSKQIGRFELAHGSTLFLDEIAELPLDMQVKLLRVLENHTIERLGNPNPVPVDVRIIAATNRDLLAAVREGRFRGDLYYRLNVFPISVPALRERREDIPLFVQAFVDELAGPMGKRIEEIDSASLDDLLAYPWPGNVRELRNAVERAMILSTGTRLRISTPERAPVAASMTGQTHMERTHILQVLRDTGWRIRGPHGAAERLGLKPTTLESRIKKLGLIRPSKAA